MEKAHQHVSPDFLQMVHMGFFLGFSLRVNVRTNQMCSYEQDFEMNRELKLSVIGLLEEVLRDPDLLPQERKATANILR